MLAQMNKRDFAPMSVQQFGSQPWEQLPCGSMTTIDKGALIDISGIGWGVIARCALWENGVICNSLHLNVFQWVWMLLDKLYELQWM